MVLGVLAADAAIIFREALDLVQRTFFWTQPAAAS